ncbi:MAG: metalloregulator ArsR/SmtB family transcription factor [Acidobacteriota bacterium]
MARSATPLKHAVYAQLARLGRALASPARLDLLELLAMGPRTVEALARESGQSLANTSHHLQVLRRDRLVDAEKQGQYVTYRIAHPEVTAFLTHLKRLAHRRLAELDQLLRDYHERRGTMETVDRDELARRVQSGEVTVVDVRPREEYDAGHLPGALSIPLPDLERRLRELPRSREIVAYCRGPYCVMALDAVDLLRRHGFAAHRLADGVVEWRARGGRIHRAAGIGRRAGGPPRTRAHRAEV